jgi:ribokinase
VAVVVVGSLNIDVAVDVGRLPAAGATVLATGGPRRSPGGKGLNQAVAAARQGASVAIVGAVGDDDDGRALLEGLRVEGVDTGGVAVSAEAPTGLALITVDATGANTIVVVAGANATVATPALGVVPGDVVLAQLEVPLATITGTLQAAHASGATTILNASPPVVLPPALLDAVDLLVVNEHEVEVTGLGRRATVVTLGEHGARLHRDPDAIPEHVPSLSVDAVDTTGAGDAFAGTLAAALDGSLDLDLGLDEPLRRASVAGALTTTRRGAAPALPTVDEVDEAYKP